MKNLFIQLLKKSESYTKTDMIYLIGQGSWLITGQAAVFASSLLLAWVFANYVSPADYGIYKYILSVATIATVTTVTGLSTSLARAVSQGHNVNLIKILKTRMYFGVLGSFGFLITALYYFLVDNMLLAALLAGVAFFIPFYDSLSDYQFFLQGKKDFKTQTFLRIIQRLLLSVTVIGSIFFTHNIIIITVTFFAASAASHFIALQFTLRKYPPDNNPDVPYTEIMEYGKRLSVQNIFVIGVTQLDKILMFKFLGPAQLATYFFAIAIPQELNGVLGNINSVAFPKLVNKHTHEFKISLLKKISLFSLLLTIPVGLYVLSAPFLFNWFFPVYSDAVYVSQLFVGSMLFIPSGLIWHYFYAVDNKKALWYGTFIGPGTLILGIILFVPYFGILGAVAATYLRSIIDLSVGLYFFLRNKDLH